MCRNVPLVPLLMLLLLIASPPLKARSGGDSLASLPDTIWDFYPNYPSYETLMAQFAALHPGLCRLEALDTLSSGRRLLALVISDHVDSLEAEPRFLYTSSMHGDELVGYVLLLRLAEHLLGKYGIDPMATALVDGLEIWINPLANPDGTFRNGNNTLNGAWRYNANSVDINRNFPDPQDGPHPDGNAWQPETQAFMALATTKKFNMSANIHGGAEVCNYPWDTWSQLPADYLWWEYVCHRYADSAQAYGPAGYFNDFGTGVTNGYDWYSISGGRQDYMNYFHQCREFTLEISNTKFPAATQLPTFWNANFRSLLGYMDQARYGLRGIVSDSLSGQPLHARVFIQGHDADSSHVWSRLPLGDYYRYLHAGTYTLTFSATGYHSRTIAGLGLINDQATVLDVKLMPTSNGVTGPSGPVVRAWFDPLARQIGLEEHASSQGQARIEIYNSAGLLVLRSGMGNSFSLPAALPGGLYLAHILTAGGQKLIVKCLSP